MDLYEICSRVCTSKITKQHYALKCLTDRPKSRTEVCSSLGLLFHTIYIRLLIAKIITYATVVAALCAIRSYIRSYLYFDIAINMCQIYSHVTLKVALSAIRNYIRSLYFDIAINMFQIYSHGTLKAALSTIRNCIRSYLYFYIAINICQIYCWCVSGYLPLYQLQCHVKLSLLTTF